MRIPASVVRMVDAVVRWGRYAHATRQPLPAATIVLAEEVGIIPFPPAEDMNLTWDLLAGKIKLAQIPFEERRD